MGLSNVENILQSIVDSEEYDKQPQSRVEELLLEVKETIEEGGGGGEPLTPEQLDDILAILD